MKFHPLRLVDAQRHIFAIFWPETQIQLQIHILTTLTWLQRTNRYKHASNDNNRRQPAEIHILNRIVLSDVPYAETS